MLDLARALELAVATARECAALLQSDFYRAGGPRGGGDKAEADTEAEWLARRRLLAAFPDWGYLGEETGAVRGRDGAPIWLVDPNDGTSDYLKGRRGSAVSIGVIAEGVPRLGVVFAFSYPDDDGDLFAWAEGCGPLWRNERAVVLPPSDALGPQDVVLLSSAADRHLEGYLACATPSRVRTLPSIAHRLALVAAGEAAAAVSLHKPEAWDYAAGHALLRAVGATIVDEDGHEIRYGPGGESRCRWLFGGRPEAVLPLVTRPWGGRARGGSSSEGSRTRLCLGEAVHEAGLLARAQGCLLGQVAGDSLGAAAGIHGSAERTRARGDEPWFLVDGGDWDLLAGQPTDASEMVLALARSIVSHGRFQPAAVRQAYQAWLQSEPFDVGVAVASALRGTPSPGSQSNAALMRASPLGIFGAAWPAADLGEIARQDAGITHVHRVCGDASAAFVIAIARAVREGDGPRAAWLAALEWARGAGADPLVVEALEAAEAEPPVCDRDAQGWVRLALQNAFYELLHAPTFEEGVIATVHRGGDTNTNAAVTGALLGAVHRREAVPQQWRSMILSCHPCGQAARHPRPPLYWPIDVLELAERVLLAGKTDAGRQTSGGASPSVAQSSRAGP